MRVLLRKLTYANVVATLALFLAVSGGAVWAASQLGKNAVKSKNIARNAVKSVDIATSAVKTRNLAANAVKSAKIAANGVTNSDLAKEAVTRAKLKTGTLAGLQVADAQAASVPGLTTEALGAGTPVPLSGTTTFAPAAGKSYELLAELRGNPTDANGAEGGGCFAGVQIYVNGEPTSFVGIFANANGEAPFAVNGVGNASTGVGLLSSGQRQTISAGSFGDPNCGAGTSGALRITVVELG
jgi:hypothetical protein